MLLVYFSSDSDLNRLNGNEDVRIWYVVILALSFKWMMSRVVRACCRPKSNIAWCGCEGLDCIRCSVDVVMDGTELRKKGFLWCSQNLWELSCFLCFFGLVTFYPVMHINKVNTLKVRHWWYRVSPRYFWSLY